jgi:hypothetical protein
MATGRVPTTANSPLTAKGDLFGYSTTQARVAVGNDGETLVADSSTSTGLRYQGSITAGKNFAINGGFDIWQRGTSSGATGYLADRWTSSIAGTTTVSQETSDLPTAIGVQYGIKYVTSAASSYAQFYQALETATVKPMRGQVVTISAWVKLTGGYAGSLVCNMDYSTTTDAAASQTTNVASAAFGNAVDAATWVRKSLTFTVPSTAVGLRIGLIPDTAQASGVTVRVTGVQLELGSVPTTFSRAGGTIQGELAACQRYYYRNSATANNTTMGLGFASSSTNVMGIIQFPVMMRTAPTSIDFSTIQCNDSSTGTAVSAVAFSGVEYGTLLATVNFTTSGMTTYRPTKIISNGSTAGYLGFSAEL